MTDPNERITSTTTGVGAPATSAHAADFAADPLASLHKMSTTAGISSQEYVAINVPSLLALLLGAASVLAVLMPVPLLLIPVLGVMTGLVSLSQIRRSNGTQTGRGFALLGIVLSLVIGGLVLVRAVVEQNRGRADQAAIAQKIEEFGRHISAKEYDKAYALFSERFRARVERATFDATWEQSQSYPELGRIESMKWNQTGIIIEKDPNSENRVSSAYAWVKFEKSPEMARHPMVFRTVDGQWVLDDIPQVFPSRQRRPTR
jgi:hypothetical protein